MGLFVVLLGGPGAGKGTQADLLGKALQLPHVSSGDLFRAALKADTELGREVKGYLARGELVPDALTIAMVAQRLDQADCQRGAVLDGFPRTIDQAEALDGVLAARGEQVTVVAFVNVGEDVLLARLSGRWTCRICQAVYHLLYKPPREAGKCDVCGGELYQRADDSPETHKRRIEVYLEQTAPLVQFYRERHLLVDIDGEARIEDVQARLLAVVQRAGRQQRLDRDKCRTCVD
jgi:adenylate kinase